jgi:dGTPase
MSEKITDYAVADKSSKGRQFPEPPHRYRSDFERDRDRIIHCSAFRRLEGKTQVFTPGQDDHYRTRLTHSIEVAQIGRTIAKALDLNETLTEAICLAHDLGHCPFGHAGEAVLDKIMARFDGFEHNRQTLRIVDLLEHPYPDFVGLNLTYETRLGLAKHKGPYDEPKGSVFIEANSSLEGQVAEIADRIAYNCHDLEDGLRSGLIINSQLKDIEIFKKAQEQIEAQKINDKTTRSTRTAKAIIEALVSETIDQSKKSFSQTEIKTVEDVYAKSRNLILLSEESDRQLPELERFLLANLYQHELVMENLSKVKDWLEHLFKIVRTDPELMPHYFQSLIADQGLERTVCDYIAGMTDRYCLKILNTNG